MSESKTDDALPGSSDLFAPDVLHDLAEACRDFRADSVERVALFEAAAVTAKLPPEVAEREGRLGPLGLTQYWGPAPARLDNYTAATSFLKEARRLRESTRGPVVASRLARRVHGGSSSAPYARAWRAARRVHVDLPADEGAEPAERAERMLALDH